MSGHLLVVCIGLYLMGLGSVLIEAFPCWWYRIQSWIYRQFNV